jgi:PAS domain S-box-containing protein/putative nucleotidyltransferase with HDIG domain
LDSNNTIIGITCVAIDITSRKKAEQELKVSEENYRTLFENTGTAMLVIEEDMVSSMVNTQCEKLTGYSKEEIENKMKWTDFVLPEDLERMKKYHIERRKAGGKAPTEYEFRLIDKKGNIRDMFLKIGMIPNTKKSVVSMIDITELKKVQEGLRSSREKYFNLFNNANDLIQVANPVGKLLTVNKKWLEILEYSQEEVKGLRVNDIIRKDKLKQISKQMQKTLKGKNIDFETVFISKSGKEINVEGRGNGLFKDGKFVSAMGIFRDITKRRQAEEKLKKTMDAALQTMSKIIEVKDPYTAGHQQRVSQLAAAIAKELDLSQDKVEGIRVASLIHDIGKIGIPSEILSKSTALSDIEFSLIKAHAQIGYDILKSIDFSYPVAQIVLQHHEKMDGSGYPNGLREENILQEAKIICVADVVEAMSSHRPYRPALGIDAALEEISQNKGILYDAEVVNVCLNLFKKKGFKFE